MEKSIFAEHLFDDMPDEFTTGDFQISVFKSGEASERTARNWRKDMDKSGILENMGWGKWKKALKLINKEDG